MEEGEELFLFKSKMVVNIKLASTVLHRLDVLQCVQRRRVEEETLQLQNGRKCRGNIERMRTIAGSLVLLVVYCIMLYY